MDPRVTSWALPVPSEPPGQCLLLFLASRPRTGAGSVLSSVLLLPPVKAWLTLTITSTPTREAPTLPRSPQDPEKFWPQTMNRCTQTYGLTQFFTWLM